ncbi:hypothetical protein [Bifidobacterium sp. SO1]|uniref:hypothetical protein n=1 Tax=Bifidobacterium sp. SO1 TaxID=2809029 RepID=UPI001BDC2CD2|nr:hypothetical protein [Bifidobacterium sp. SO1]MBT1162868.1 hypothetical protein [Bifidobacterium sp. SO1]
MRIRSIKPEFWRSRDIAKLDWDTRLIFIGLWSYVDDNGVGKDIDFDIIGDLFASDLMNDPRETVARVSRALATLSEAGLIYRYEVDGTPYLEIVNWAKHQRIDKPGKPRYPKHNAQNGGIPTKTTDPRESVARVSRECRDISTPGTGEQGNRGTGEQGNSFKTGFENLSDTFSNLHTENEVVEAEIIEEPSSSEIHQIPDDWKPTAHSRLLAQQLGIDCDDVARKFMNWMKNRHVRLSDFDLEFDEWLRRERTPSRSESRAKANSRANQELRQRIAQKEKEFMERNGYAAN